MLAGGSNLHLSENQIPFLGGCWGQDFNGVMQSCPKTIAKVRLLLETTTTAQGSPNTDKLVHLLWLKWELPSSKRNSRGSYWRRVGAIITLGKSE